MATTALNIVQRLGGPMLTTLMATFLAWRLRAAPLHNVPIHDAQTGPYLAAFLLLCMLHAMLLAAALRLPLSIAEPAKQN